MKKNRKAIGITALFDKLGVRLRNHIWSWGGVRADGAVFLRVWEDETRTEGNRIFVRVTKHQRYQKKVPKHRGYLDRLEHLARVKNGATSYMVICVAKDVKAIPRSVKSFNSDELYRGGKLIDFDGDSWLEILRSVSVKDVQLPSPGGR